MIGENFREDLQKAVEIMRKGGIILYPTDTIWGIGCDATNRDAVKRIYELKKRTEAKSMLVLIDSEVRLERLSRSVPEIAYDLIEVADKPLTIVYPDAYNVAPELISEDGTLGIRLTRELFSKELCRMMRGAIVSTSANVSGEPSPKCFAEISDEIRSGVDYIVSYRQDEVNPEIRPSQIIALGAGGEVRIIRP